MPPTLKISLRKHTVAGHPPVFNCVSVAVLSTQATATLPCAILTRNKLSVVHTNRKMDCKYVQL
jgi:hypothetical protein